MNRINSESAYREALKYIPGGVNSPVRSLRSVGEQPIFIREAKGVVLTDVDNNRLTDFCLSWGVFILGHNHPKVNEAVIAAVSRGTSYGIPSLQETELAKLVNAHIPSMERVRFVNSGTEAVMSAVRLARGYTGRDVLVKFDGCYHGHADHLLVSAGSGLATINGGRQSSSSGVPESFISCTVSLPFNSRSAVEQVFKEIGGDIAAVIVEPTPANMGVVLPCDGFLEYLREVTERHGSLLIFDEVISGFRLSLGGAQQLFGVSPDLTTIGKIVGGGFPAAAFGGRADIMNLLAPDGPVYQAGTLSGNPVAMSAGIETLNILSSEGFYSALNSKASAFIEELKQNIAGKDIVLNSVGSMFTLFFSSQEVDSFEAAKSCDLQRFGLFFRHLLRKGFYISPSQFEANFISAAHSEKELERFVKEVKNAVN
ncbi:MAG: glutamate-1-semialdehyde 2,1-aminomutase [Prevotellaceae bacterium]|jgi:glutamate-1-semialdehyde 2,1-aminomutase|nr:glutamate-1-semialdehyde 2,1-aminomutase [Prevotellaceae bacterium]